MDTDALLMALMAKGVGPGDIIFTSPFIFIATAEPRSLSMHPYLADKDIERICEVLINAF